MRTCEEKDVHEKKSMSDAFYILYFLFHLKRANSILRYPLIPWLYSQNFVVLLPDAYFEKGWIQFPLEKNC